MGILRLFALADFSSLRRRVFRRADFIEGAKSFSLVRMRDFSYGVLHFLQAPAVLL
jgi:hypothetical protein